MNRKLMIIIALIIILIIGYTVFSLTREDSQITAHEECINNSSEVYLVITIQDSHGNVINSSMGKLQIELIDEISDQAMGGHSYIDIPIENGKFISREPDSSLQIDVKYDGGYLYKPSEYSSKLEVINNTNLTDNDLTKPY